MVKDQVVRSPVVLALLVAAPVAAQIGPSGLASAIRTTATTRIEQPATLTSSQDLAFSPQAAIATTRATVATASTAAITTATAPATATATSGGNAAGAATATGGGPGSSLRTATSASLALPVAAVVPATFTVAGDSGQAISVTVPPTVELESGGGSGGTAKLSTTSSLAEGPQFLGGSFAGGGTLSFAVGGQVMLASNTVASAGTYNGVLMVVAQYN